MIHLQLLGSVDLRDDLGAQLRPVLAQPKRLALLAYLALGNGQSRRRDMVLAQLWPELDTARARSALRQALHHLRRELGEDALLIEGEGLAIDAAVIKCDVYAFESAMKTGDDAGALALYRGDLLEGVHVSDASVEWESWLDAERARLRDAALAATERLVTGARARGDSTAAISYARRACQFAPDDDARACTMIELLDAAGDRTGALRVYDAFARRLGRDDEQVSAEMSALVARIRGARAAASGNGHPNGHSNGHSNGHFNSQSNGDAAASAEQSSDPPRETVAPATTQHPRRRRTALPLAIAAIAIVASVTAWRVNREPDPTVLAVGLIRDHTGSPELSAAVSELLATDLARAAGSRVISTSRMYELLSRVDSTGGERARLGRAARAAGAMEFVEGALYRDSGGLRLELERVNLSTGRTLSVRSINGADPFVLSERATGSILGTMNMSRARGNLRDVVTQSPMALRFYQEGMRARAQNDRAAARRLFTAAVAEDSSFAMATFELAMLEPQVGPLHLRALHLAAGTSDRERLMIQATLAHLLDDPASRTFAETLAVRYPNEPEGPLMLGRAFVAEGRFTDAIAPLRRVIVMDSASLRAGDACRACDAYAEMVSSYIFMDSLPAAERVAREFLARQPTRADARFQLVNVLQHEQRYDEARSVVTEIEEASGATLGEYGTRAELLIREGRLNEAEAYLLRIIDATTGDDRANAQWNYVILLRTQGRYREALAVADRLRARDAAPPAPPGQKFWSAGMRATILYDMGRFADAISLRDSVVRVPFGYTESRQARSTVGELGNIATARAALGDTAGLRVLAEQMERMGRLTGYAIHRRMYHYVRGLRLGLIGRHDEAAAEIRESIYSPIAGFVRESYELGRELVAAGKPREAADVLTRALRGPVGAGGISVTRPQLEMLLARAHEMQADTVAALAGYGRAIAAWERADPSVAATRALAVGRIRALTR